MTAIARFRCTLALWIDTARTRSTLATLDERTLADIGVTRAQAMTEAKRWFWDCAPRMHDALVADAPVGVVRREAQILPWPGRAAHPPLRGEHAA